MLLEIKNHVPTVRVCVRVVGEPQPAKKQAGRWTLEFRCSRFPCRGIVMCRGTGQLSFMLCIRRVLLGSRAPELCIERKSRIAHTLASSHKADRQRVKAESQDGQISYEASLCKDCHVLRAAAVGMGA